MTDIPIMAPAADAGIWNACNPAGAGHDKFVVSRAGDAYDARVRCPNRKFLIGGLCKVKTDRRSVEAIMATAPP
jgi:hypothetical protein